MLNPLTLGPGLEVLAYEVIHHELRISQAESLELLH